MKEGVKYKWKFFPPASAQCIDQLAAPTQHLLCPKPEEDAPAHAVYTVPSFATDTECDALLLDAHKRLESLLANKSCRQKGWKKELVRLPLAPNPAKVEVQLLHRLLALVEMHMPALAMEVFGQATDLADAAVAFSPGEPAVNVYTAGGQFSPHYDQEALTMLVPLSALDTHTGGGTAFWATAAVPPKCDRPVASPDADGLDADDETAAADADAAGSGEGQGGGPGGGLRGQAPPPTRARGAGLSDDAWYEKNPRNWLPPDLVCRPLPGTAVIFGGGVLHAGLPVAAGTRHILVMSFNLRNRHQRQSEPGGGEASSEAAAVPPPPPPPPGGEGEGGGGGEGGGEGEGEGEGEGGGEGEGKGEGGERQEGDCAGAGLLPAAGLSDY
jgi:hypothetical protein